MASMVPKILGVEESTAKELTEFLKGRGLNGKLQACQRNKDMTTMNSRAPLHLDDACCHKGLLLSHTCTLAIIQTILLRCCI